MKSVAHSPLILLSDRPYIRFTLKDSEEIHDGTFIGHDFIQYPLNETEHPIYHSYESVDTFEYHGDHDETKLVRLQSLLKTAPYFAKGITCIYHAGCSDGLMSAAIVKRFYGQYSNLTFVEGRHGEVINPEDFTGQLVIIVDFSYEPKILQEISKHAFSLVMLDHHKTTMEKLQENYDDITELLNESFIVLADKKSGAGLTWEVLFPNEKMFDAVRYVQDADIWTWSQPHSKEIVAAIYHHTDKTIDSYYQLFFRYSFEEYLKLGRILVEKKTEDVKHAVNSTYQQVMFKGYKVGIANCNTMLSSEVGHYIIENYNVDFGLAFSFTPKGVRLSLRSDDHLQDVSYIAREFLNGGGHRNASGGSLSYEDFYKYFLKGTNTMFNLTLQHQKALLGCQLIFDMKLQIEVYVSAVLDYQDPIFALSDGSCFVANNYDLTDVNSVALYLSEDEDSPLVSVKDYFNTLYPEVSNGSS